MIAITVYADGRVTLSKSLLKKYELTTGDKVIIKQEERFIKVIPVKKRCPTCGKWGFKK